MRETARGTEGEGKRNRERERETDRQTEGDREGRRGGETLMFFHHIFFLSSFAFLLKTPACC
jgi:hypothetical protein